MKKITLLITAATLSLLSSVGASTAVTTINKIDNFELTDTNGLAHQLYYYSYAPAVVLSSQNTTLPRVVGTENLFQYFLIKIN